MYLYTYELPTLVHIYEGYDMTAPEVKEYIH